MREPLRTVPFYLYDQSRYPLVPEFNGQLPSIYVPMGEVRVADNLEVLESHGFRACSGMIIRSELGPVSGLLHSTPITELYEYYMMERWQMLAGGQLIWIPGSGSEPQDDMLAALRKKLGIKHIDTIPIDTTTPQGKNMSYHIALNSAKNELLVARGSHKELLTFRAFE